MSRFLILALLALAGCTAAGPVFNESSLSKDGETATIVVYRDNWYQGPVIAGWYIDVNGVSSCGLKPDGFFAKQVSPGEIVISSSMFGAPGTSRIAINAKAGEIYYILMELDGGKNIAMASGGLAGGLMAEAASNHGGPFIFSRIDKNTAIKTLSSRHQDCL